ncbi:hypothetical protein [Polaromonas sp. AER18D-145]|uniref:hypothetical protein n=1 Tax=Polaromonas sp. AER18D-145 TaxID=1977060 RepID=UPI001481E0E1|nr:hypothetical protein [Polaromonas sp. AER18D-145]
MSSELRARLIDIRNYLRRLGVHFVIATEATLASEVCLQNTRLLARAHRDAATPNPNLAILKPLLAERPSTYGALVRLFGSRTSLSALACGLVYFDVHSALCLNTPLTYTLKEKFDAAGFIYTKPVNLAVPPELRDCFYIRQ